MLVYRLTRSWEAGFKQGSDDLGLFISRKLAKRQAEILEPNKEIRDYEYGIRAIKVKEKVSKKK